MLNNTALDYISLPTEHRQVYFCKHKKTERSQNRLTWKKMYMDSCFLSFFPNIFQKGKMFYIWQCQKRALLINHIQNVLISTHHHRLETRHMFHPSRTEDQRDCSLCLKHLEETAAPSSRKRMSWIQRQSRNLLEVSSPPCHQFCS